MKKENFFITTKKIIAQKSSVPSLDVQIEEGTVCRLKTDIIDDVTKVVTVQLQSSLPSSVSELFTLDVSLLISGCIPYGDTELLKDLRIQTKLCHIRKHLLAMKDMITLFESFTSIELFETNLITFAIKYQVEASSDFYGFNKDDFRFSFRSNETVDLTVEVGSVNFEYCYSRFYLIKEPAKASFALEDMKEGLSDLASKMRPWSNLDPTEYLD